MNRLKSFFNIFLFSCVCTCLTACVDDGLGFSSDLKDGETILNLEAAFSPFAEGNLTRTSLTPDRRGFNELSDLVILVYDKEGNILQDEDGNNFIKKIDFDQNAVENEIRGDSDTSNDKAPAESDTKSLKNIPLKLPFGEYYIIGVANLGSYTDSGSTKTTLYKLTTDYADDIQTLDGLRRIKVDWEADNYRNNREMLGYFTDPDAQAPRSSSIFPTVKVNRPGMQLRAWLRRCASKITIDFDGSELRDNVYIYIKDARIYDLAKDCTLGFGQPNIPDEDIQDYNNTVGEGGLLDNEKSAHHIDYGEGDDFASWPCITKGTPYIMEGDVKKDFHTQESEALYFYENMQGEGVDRTPVPDLGNGGVSNNIEKDGKDFGTYIEVTAHYHSDADGNIADYDIKYRFMIGKNVTTNYDAERNYHYKLTLKFRGNANDYHWHIDYNETEGFDVPNPWYVSYLYNHDAMLPFKYTAPEGWTVKRMEANIITNPWYPSDFTDEELTDPTKEIKPVVPSGDEEAPYEDDGNKYDGNGFLSLRAPKEDNVITDIDATGEAFTGYGNLDNKKINEAFYRGESPSNSTVNKSQRVIIEGGVVKNDTGNERENITSQKTTINGKESYSINIPLFTRAKIMVKQTGYSGNNPFVGYQRIARVRMTVTLEKNGEEKTDYADVNVVQVRRVVNPKGVYRSKDNYSPFHVTMMFLSGDDANATFRTIKSRGPWTAEIIGDKNFITLNGQQTVSGITGSDIDFTIRFNRLSSAQNKNAVIRVRYHNYTCTHLIFVRQGYDAQAICSSGVDFLNKSGGATPTKWETRNMIAADYMAEDPRDEGSMFKFGEFWHPIDAINNVYKINEKEVYYNLTKDDFTPHDSFQTINGDGSLIEGGSMTWTDFNSNQSGFTNAGDKKIAKAATMRDFEQLYLTPNVQFGYGVLYADGATETQSTIDMAYGYSRHDESADAKSKGMRGMFAYYWDRNNSNDQMNGKNIFFPIGRSGYGHRKNSNEKQSDEKNYNGKGILRYSANRCMPASEYGGVYANFKTISPLFESIYRRPGAIYWARNKTNDREFLEWNGEPTPASSATSIAYGLDINYFTFDVNAITGSNIDNGNDACFVRTVE